MVFSETEEGPEQRVDGAVTRTVNGKTKADAQANARAIDLRDKAREAGQREEASRLADEVRQRAAEIEAGMA